MARLRSVCERWFFRNGWRRTTVIGVVVLAYLALIMSGLFGGGVPPIVFEINFFLILVAALSLRLPGAVAAATVSALLVGPFVSQFVRLGDLHPPDWAWVPRVVFFELFGLLAGLVSELWLRESQSHQSTTDRLVRAEKMGLVGRLASGIAHDFNNILTVIMGFSEVTATRLEERAAALEGLDKILDAARRGASLSHQILAYSRRQILSPSIVDLNQVIRELKAILERVAGEQISIEVSLDSSLSPTKIDYSQLEQVIMNLAVNARDAIEGTGTITITTQNVLLTQNHRDRRSEISPGGYVLLTIADTGIGMSEEVSRRVFDPYFTTKSRGTGLGLSTVYGIVKQSKGYIYVDSGIAKGTAFRVYLPAVDGVPGARRVGRRLSPGSRRRQRDHQRILFVEDDVEVLSLMGEALRSNGYLVQTAHDAREALELFRAGQAEPDLLIVDIVLPDRDGFELFRQLKVLRSDLKCIYVTGYGRDYDPDPVTPETPPTILEKPFGVMGLLEAVRSKIEEEESKGE